MDKRTFITSGLATAALLSPTLALADACTAPDSRLSIVNMANARAVVKLNIEQERWHNLDTFMIPESFFFDQPVGKQYPLTRLADDQASWMPMALAKSTAWGIGNNEGIIENNRINTLIDHLESKEVYKKVLYHKRRKQPLSERDIRLAVDEVRRDVDINDSYKVAVIDGLNHGSWLRTTTNLAIVQAGKIPEHTNAIMGRLMRSDGTLPFYELAQCRNDQFGQKHNKGVNLFNPQPI